MLRNFLDIAAAWNVSHGRSTAVPSPRAPSASPAHLAS
jgi:hypothetical protein